MVAQTGYSGQTVTVLVEDGGRIVGSEEVDAAARGRADAGARALHGVRVRRAPVPVPRSREDGERVLENNEQEALIHVRDGREKILYFEGEPRFEVRFLRRAVAADSNLQVVTLQRTADGEVHAAGRGQRGRTVQRLPDHAEELFSYRALILGSIEASHFTHEQLRMIAEFVSERGGGLLMLGGRHAFAEGGYAGTPVAEALPVTLDAQFSRDTMFFDTLNRATDPGRRGAAGAAGGGQRANPRSAGAHCRRRPRTTASVR
jgi:hypothetical protein